MSTERASLGFGDETDDFSWAKPAPKPKPDTKRAAEAAGFRSREPVAPKAVEEPPKQRRRRTGRNVQFNIKTRAETIEEFCRIADECGMGLGEAFEFATKLLAQHHTAQNLDTQVVATS
ncbi:hypothetical protein ASG43_21580 [Aureimonas sp. Leaf454]|uniref:hypothetical protein n=1 Tax=Aureimonas sp. Leaf454 TaxID=1736381 RepID=UPI0006FCCB94|nr:hypothetical protein [Aureimonas sp. Leaf454]KQT50270.1 hypothetical protein ASG43_21580 [Aureimonas sp. Leaf454]